MIRNLEYHKRQFQEQGFTVLDNQISDADNWKENILKSLDLNDVYVPENMRKVAAGKGSLKYSALDRYQTDRAIKEINTYYLELVELLRILTDQNIVISPYDRTAYYAKVYKNKGDEQGWHYDTNGLTVIVYLTDNLLTGRTEIERLDNGKQTFVCPKTGAILIMQGRRCWHRAEPIDSGIKVICPLNYYVDKAEERDLRLDDIIFGNIKY